MEIIEINPIYSKLIGDHRMVVPCLQFTKEYWRQGPYRKIRKTFKKYLIDKDGVFLTGYIPRIVYFVKKNYKVDIQVVHLENKTRIEKPSLNGITFKEEQLDLIRKAVTRKRGVIKAPTGTGKTIVALGICSALPDLKCLILVHTKSLLTQFKEEIERFKLRDRIKVQTIQTFIKEVDEEKDDYGVFIVDECHHVSGFETQYAQVLQKLECFYRFGLTATLPVKQEGVFALEGLIGPVIGNLTLEEGNKIGLLAKPKIELIKVPKTYTNKDVRRYHDVYQEFIVKNKTRNKLIVNKAKEYINNNKSVLINVVKIEHADILSKLLKEAGIKPYIVKGEVTKDIRERIKKALNNKNIKCVISTAVWREGVNIPSLNVIINAAGGRSEIATLQAIGRGLRRTKDKDEVIVVDFFDQNHYHLITHFGERICLYFKMGWL